VLLLGVWVCGCVGEWVVCLCMCVCCRVSDKAVFVLGGIGDDECECSVCGCMIVCVSV